MTRSSQSYAYHANVGREPPRCLICETTLAPGAWFEGWCVGCASRALASLLSLRDLPRGQVATLADIFRQVHQPFLSEVIVGRIPFQPTTAELDRLTDE